jgi:hypothetical protein
MNHKKLNSRCKAKAKSGEPCGAAATKGGDLCYFHANPNQAAELGRIGGRSKCPAASENADPLPTLDSALAVRETLARLIADVYAGKLNPRVAAGLAPLLNLLLHVIEITEITNKMERRIAKVEKLLAEAQDRFETMVSAGLSLSSNPVGDGRESR